MMPPSHRGLGCFSRRVPLRSSRTLLGLLLALALKPLVFAQDAAPADRNAINTVARPGDMKDDSPVTFPKEGPLPAQFPPDIQERSEPAEKDYYLFSSPCRSLGQIAAIQQVMPRGRFTHPLPDWGYLPRTRRILTEGGTLNLLAVGDSIINDTMRSGWVAKLQEAYPAARIQATVYVRGGGGCQHYREEGRVEKYIVPHRPDLVLIGGISQRDLASIREVIHQVRQQLPEAEFLLMTGAFGTVDPRDPAALALAAHSGTAEYGRALRAVAREERCAFLDMTTPWAEYIRSSGLHPHRFYRDVVHANELGEQILSKILMAFWAPELDGLAPDSLFLQETGRKVGASEPLAAVAAFAGQIWVGSGRGLSTVAGDQLVRVEGHATPVTRLVATRESLWKLSSEGLQQLQGGTWRRITSQPVSDVTEHLGRVVASSGNRLFEVRNGSLDPLTSADGPFPVVRVSSHCETLYVLGPGRLAVVDGSHIGQRNAYSWEAVESWDWGALPSPRLRDFLSDGPRLLVGTDRGVGVLRGMALSSWRGQDGLPYEDVTCLTRGFTNDVWIGTTRGAIRRSSQGYDYFAGQRWLPSDHVNALAVEGQTVYVATDAGLGIIEYRPFTLSAKAAYYEEHLARWGQKRLGFTHKLEWDDARKEFVREVSDNDGGYSGSYLAAQSYRYAVTKDPAARREAVKTFNALRWLESITGIPGFPARAVWAKSEVGHQAMHGSGDQPAEWHTAADPRFEWKGDTSSDELCSHFYSVALFLEHAAQGDEIAQAKSHLARIASHLIEHRWQLIDLDGKPTRWGRWDPEYFHSDEGHFDRGLQCLEILSFMKTAAVLTGDPKFAKAYRELVDLGYPAYTVRQRQTFPPDSIAHFDDELALWSYSNLLKYETDPQLRSVYRRSLERTWEIVRIEKNPWFNFVYGVLSGNDCEVGSAVAHLRQWPLDLVIWSYQNSQRTDLQTPPGYQAYKGGTRTFSPRETEPLRWDHWTMQADGGAGGRDVIEPGAWLLTYWMGRYHGYIGSPDPSAVKAAVPIPVPPGGARPYEGPARPE